MMKKEEEKKDLSRRTFIGTAAVVGLVAAGCSVRSTEDPAVLTPGPDRAPEGAPLKAGLIGCGGRGTGAAVDFLSAGPELQVTALADVFSDRLESCRERLREAKGVEVADENCFVGFDAYQRLLETDVDVVLDATPPHFRPLHFAAAVAARKHVFLEKPVAVDASGVRSVMDTADRADAFQLSVATGTQYRHQKSFIETYNQVVRGAIGDIVAARCYSLRGQLWYRTPRPEWSQMEAMLRDWVNWRWLSGDFIVEQHVHGLDAINWFTRSRPARAVATGGRARRVTGDQYDFMSVDFEMESGIHVHSFSRQIDGCTNEISRWVEGTRGFTNCADTIFDRSGNVVWKYGEAEGSKEEETVEDNSPYVQEHIDLVASIRQGRPINEARENAISTLTAIMGRESAYTGLETNWEEQLNSGQRLGPSEYAMGPVDVEARIPVPGIVREDTRTG
jgi:myo-inositol 2-dehydrogenase / D-chiro-inositol 1-dehydrogenase